MSTRRIVRIDDAAEAVRLQNLSQSAVDLTGWTMCRVGGAERHPIFGVIGPGETQIFPNSGPSIWSNSNPDPGLHYDAEGRLISTWDEYGTTVRKLKAEEALWLQQTTSRCCLRTTRGPTGGFSIRRRSSTLRH